MPIDKSDDGICGSRTSPREYLGDGVYVTFEHHSFVLTTGHHNPALADAVIVLDAGVLAALERFVARLRGPTP